MNDEVVWGPRSRVLWLGVDPTDMLMHACSAPNIQHVITLLKAYGPNDEALIEACRVGRPDIVREMLVAGANANTVRTSHNFYNFACKYVLTPLIVSCSYHEKDKIDVAKVLIEFGADVNGLDECGRTPLMHAANASSAPRVKLLIDSGANVGTRTRELGYTALRYARCAQICRYLIDAGIDVNTPDTYGLTPLMHAAEANIDDVARELLAAGANVNARSRAGKTAAEYANTCSMRILLQRAMA